MAGPAVAHSTFQRHHPHKEILRKATIRSRGHLLVALNLAKHPFDMAGLSEKRTFKSAL